MQPFDTAWALGQWDPGDPVLRVWVRVADGHGVETTISGDIANVLLLLTPQSLVLLKFGLDVANSTFEKLRKTKAKLIVYIPPDSRRIEPHMAVQLCSEGVLGFFAARDDLPASLERRLKNLYCGNPMFGKIELSFRGEKSMPQRAFLSSPFGEFGAEFLDAAEAALLGRGIRVEDPRRVHRGIMIAHKVDALIDEADFVVANTRLTDRGSNPNVWLEIGYARHSGKPTILYLYAGDGKVIASDLEGTEYLEYHDGLDLAMQLYWGLEWIGKF
jgi:hypothetical protein